MSETKNFLMDEVVYYGGLLTRFVGKINKRMGTSLSIKNLLGFTLEERVHEIEKEEDEEALNKRLETTLDLMYVQISNLESEYANIFDEVVNDTGDNPAVERFKLFDNAGLEPDATEIFEYVDFLNDDEVDAKIRKPHDLQKYQAEDFYIGGNSEDSE